VASERLEMSRTFVRRCRSGRSAVVSSVGWNVGCSGTGEPEEDNDGAIQAHHILVRKSSDSFSYF
jgi:hypothetical protein